MEDDRITREDVTSSSESSSDDVARTSGRFVIVVDVSVADDGRDGDAVGAVDARFQVDHTNVGC